MLSALLLPLLVSPVQEREPISVREVLAVESLGERRRSPVYTDALEALVARGAWRAPAEGDLIVAADGEQRRWTRHEADENGWFQGGPFSRGWAWTTVEVQETGAWRLDLRGASDVLVDGEPHAGDVYTLGTTRIPLALTGGEHELLFRCGRGRMLATLEPAPAPVYLEERDRTLPDVIRGEDETLWLGTIVSNALPEVARGYRLRARGGATGEAAVPPLLPSSLRKCGLAVEVEGEPEGGELRMTLELLGPDGIVVHADELTLAVRAPTDVHKRTFVSAIDGSVQYYAVTPPAGEPESPALVLSLHGAGVEARGQAACYTPKDWAVVVAPTNRRPFGFDWEDWGRLDALEVLELARERFGTDPRKTLLTGHSMGGHGTWQVGAHFPGTFAAIAPSAGWRDFWSYAGGSVFPEDDAVGALLARAANASRTGLLESNYASQGVYVLHGDADDNVPVSEARAMRAALGAFHADFAYYERPGAGHWWGNQCLDWPPLIEFLRRHALPEPAEVRELDFTTVDASVSARHHWVTVQRQTTWLEPSRVRAKLDPKARTLALELENVARLVLDLAPFAEALEGEALAVTVDEDAFELAPDAYAAPVTLGRDGGGPWKSVTPLAPWYKSRWRAGPFKAGFRRQFLLVYPTQGTAEENAFWLAKARYDHEQWRYRGNGAVDVLADVDLAAEAFPERDVVLYGNQEINAAWPDLLGPGAIGVTRAGVRIGTDERTGDDLALLAVYPRKGCDLASVAVVAASGMPGARTTTFLPYFVSGVGYPDWTVIGTEMLEHGLAGVRGAGFFRDDWSTELGAETAWRE